MHFINNFNLNFQTNALILYVMVEMHCCSVFMNETSSLMLCADPQYFIKFAETL